MNDTADQEFWRCVLSSRGRRPVDEAGFVLTALGLEHRVEWQDGRWNLWVPLHVADRARHELDTYQRENTRAGRPTGSLATVDSGWAGVAGFLLVLWLLPTLEAQLVFGWDWREIGHMHAGRVMAGEWWRTLTALTLHGDLGHIVGNSIFGAVFGLFLGRQMGSGIGWLLVLISGALGNGINAFLQVDEFRSVGASTATFAAVGLLAAFTWQRGFYRNVRWQRSFAPVAAAIALLAFTGMGGENTDIVAHFTGFACGIAFGALAAQFDLRQLDGRGQLLAGVTALGLIATAWAMAGTAA